VDPWQALEFIVHKCGASRYTASEVRRGLFDKAQRDAAT